MELVHLKVITVVYLSALTPIFVMLWLHFQKKLSRKILIVYIGSFLACALGFEIWFTYGLIDGDNVNLRRHRVLSHYIPLHVNWLLNSLADAGSIGLGGLLLLKLVFKTDDVLKRWHWGAFAVLSLWLIGQNIGVELFLYNDQLADGKQLSWAPLAPLGPWYNTAFFSYNERSLTLQGQMPWLLMTPMFYWGVIQVWRRN